MTGVVLNTSVSAWTRRTRRTRGHGGHADTENGYRKEAAPTWQPLVGRPKVNPTSGRLRGPRNRSRVPFSDVSFGKIRFNGQRTLSYPIGSRDRRVNRLVNAIVNHRFEQRIRANKNPLVPAASTFRSGFAEHSSSTRTRGEIKT